MPELRDEDVYRLNATVWYDRPAESLAEAKRRLAGLTRLAAQWRGRARAYRDKTDLLLPNRAGAAERESLLWRARAYETAAEELTLALNDVRVA